MSRAGGTEGSRPTPDTVGRLEREALERMTALLDGAAACRFAGPRTRSVKHWEGRAAALAEARRGLAQGWTADDLLPRLVERWTTQHRAARGETWTAYCEGGLGVLAELGAVAGPPPDGAPAGRSACVAPADREAHA